MVDTMVLGGTGYVGRHICDAFAARGHEVLAVARDPVKAAPDVAFAALEDPESLDRLLRAVRPRVIVNAAGGVWEVSDEQMLGSNVTLVERLLAAAVRIGRPTRLIHLGSAHEYGATPYGASTDEEVPTSPLTDYGRAKLHATRAVCAAFASGALDGTVLRLSNVLGPDAPRSSLLGAVLRRLWAAESIGMPARLPLSAPRAYRDFVDARDVAAAAVAASESTDPTVRPVLNIGGGAPVPVRLVMERLIEIGGIPAEIVERGTGPLTRDNGDWQQLDITAAADRLGWTPHHALAESLGWAWAASSGRPATPWTGTRPVREADSSAPEHSARNEEGHRGWPQPIPRP